VASHQRITDEDRVGELKKIRAAILAGGDFEGMATQVLHHLLKVTPADIGVVLLEVSPREALEVRAIRRRSGDVESFSQQGEGVKPLLESLSEEVLRTGGAFLWRGGAGRRPVVSVAGTTPSPATAESASLLVAIPGGKRPLGLLELESRPGSEPLGELDLEFILEFITPWGHRLEKAREP
jgi:hypothetical protein